MGTDRRPYIGRLGQVLVWMAFYMVLASIANLPMGLLGLGVAMVTIGGVLYVFYGRN